MLEKKPLSLFKSLFVISLLIQFRNSVIETTKLSKSDLDRGNNNLNSSKSQEISNKNQILAESSLQPVIGTLVIKNNTIPVGNNLEFIKTSVALVVIKWELKGEF